MGRVEQQNKHVSHMAEQPESSLVPAVFISIACCHSFAGMGEAVGKPGP